MSNTLENVILSMNKKAIVTSEIDSILEKIKGTEEYDVLVEMDAIYSRIAEKQDEWFKKSKFTCVEGCGKCCEHFEPDLLESEALYMAAWLLCNQPEVAKQVAEGKFHVFIPADVSALSALHPGVRSCPSKLGRDTHPADVSRETQPRSENDEKLSFPAENHCPFYRPNLEGGKYPGHCSIYGGRASICRLFGAGGFRDKFGKEVWRPCKFYPAEELAKVPTLTGEKITHRQYNAEEVKKLLGALPPVMSDMMEQEETFTPDDDSSTLIHDILPKYIQRLMWIVDLNSGKDPI